MALSRARLGMYVFGRRELFANEVELKKCFEQMEGFDKGEGLEVVGNEFHGNVSRKVGDPVEGAASVKDVDTMMQLAGSMGA